MGKPFLSARQRASLRAVSEALLPAELLTDDLDDALDQAIAHVPNTFERSLACLLLELLSRPGMNALVFGKWELSAFTKLSLEERCRLMQGLEQSPSLEHRKTFHGLKRLIALVGFSYQTTTTSDDGRGGGAGVGTNPFWKVSDYSALRLHKDEFRMRRARQRHHALRQALQNVPPPPPHDDEEESYDFIVIGTGSGGCLATKVLAEGLTNARILVLEAGRYVPSEELAANMEDEFHSMNQLYEARGLLQTTNGNVMIVAGSTLGGGAAVNWACCLPLPTYVLDEWCGLLNVSPAWKASFLDSQAVVLDWLGVTNADGETVLPHHNIINQKVQRACQALGFHCAPTGQSLRETQLASAGMVGIGDPYANKRGGLTFLDDAVRQSDNRVVIRPQCRVKRILVQDQQAVGVEYQHHGRQTYTVRANHAILLAAGSLRTPTVLHQTSIVRANPHVGRHLHLHPATGIVGKNPNNVYGSRGAPLTTVCNEFAKTTTTTATAGGADSTFSTYGAKLEVPINYPALFAAAARWGSPEQYREWMTHFQKLMLVLAVQRDRGEGRVWANRDGSLSVEYQFHPEDQKSVGRALQGVARLMVAMGAEKIGTSNVWDDGLQLTPAETKLPTRDRDNLPSVRAYIEGIPGRGMGSLETCFFSAHQMGTSRMSANAGSGVVDAYGQVWGVQNLYVCDASIFPTASGANPMVTTLTLAHMIVSRLVRKIQNEPVDESPYLDSHSQRTRRWRLAMGSLAACYMSALFWGLA